MEPENSDFAIQAHDSAIRNSRFESSIASNPQSTRDHPYKTDMNIGILQPLPRAPAPPDLPMLSVSDWLCCGDANWAQDRCSGLIWSRAGARQSMCVLSRQRICMGLKLGRTRNFSSPYARGLEVRFSWIGSHIGFTYSDFIVLNLDIEIVNLVFIGNSCIRIPQQLELNLVLPRLCTGKLIFELLIAEN